MSPPEGRSASLPAFDREHVNIAIPIPDYKLRRKIALQQEEVLVVEAFTAFEENFYFQLKWRDSREYPDVALNAVGNGSTTLVLDVHAQSPHFTYIVDAPPQGNASSSTVRQCSPCTWSTLHTPVEVTRSVSAIHLRMDRTPVLNNDKDISLEQTVTFTLMGTLWRLEDCPTDSLQCKSYRGRTQEVSKSDCTAALLKNISTMRSDTDTQPDLAIKLHSEDEDFSDDSTPQVHHVHAFILQAHSPVIRRMLACPMTEAVQREIHMPDVSFQELQDFLDCLYHFSVPEDIANSDARLASVLALSDRYEVLALRDECAELMAKRLCEDNMGELLKIAEMHQALPLRSAALRFISCRAERIALVMDTDNTLIRKSVLEHLQKDEALRVASSAKATSHEITLTV
mmetsp:Transcript_38538/g.86665  ORF Transcript_38538/g.86665 Transcript_38538/m.86665 type:complete len:400 (+) Transcript_38538:2-1201(+)